MLNHLEAADLTEHDHACFKAQLWDQLGIRAAEVSTVEYQLGNDTL